MNDINMEEFILQPTTVPLIIRNGSLSSEALRRGHNIKVGTTLAGDYSVDYAHEDDVLDMLLELGEKVIGMIPPVLGLLDAQSLDAAGITPIMQNPYLDLRGQGVLLGFIDTGIDFTNPVFQYEDGSTKIKYIWDQTTRGIAPEGFYFGVQYNEQQINSALKSDNPTDHVSHRDTVGHGTFLASVAAGRTEGAAPDGEIIAVKLRKAAKFLYQHYLIPNQQENAYCGSDLLLGIQFILNKAAQLNRPVSICISVGTNQGGHDGFSLIEEYLSRIANTTGVAIACAAGNEGQAGHHTAGKLFAPGEVRNIEVITQQSEDLYITMWNGAPDRLAVSVKTPTGELVPKIPVRSGSSYSTNLVLERGRVSIEYYLPVRGSGDQLTIIKLFQPTPGVWTITVHGEIVVAGEYHMWLPLTGFVGSETVFLTPNPTCTIVTPATAGGTITCGAYDARINALYPYTSWGPTRSLAVAPDLVAPGVAVGGSYPTGYGKMSGTSVSAAITAGACALMLQWGIVNKNEQSLTSSRIRANLIRGCQRNPVLQYPNPQWGYGTLNLFNTLSIMRP